MKVFLGWSKETSREIARVLHNWLPMVIQSVEAFVSTEDIDLGAAWGQTLSGELQSARFGILCVTRENLSAPWLILEAGALSISTRDKANVSHVVPILFHVDRAKVVSPISQLQTTTFSRQGMWQLVTNLKKVCESYGERTLRDSALENLFNSLYPDLEEQINALIAPEMPAPSVPAPDHMRVDLVPDDTRIYSAPAPSPAVVPASPVTVSVSPAAATVSQTSAPVSPADTAPVSSNPSPVSAPPSNPSTELDAFVLALNRLQANFGFIPDMARIYVQGRQLTDQIRSDMPESDKQKAITALQTLLEEDIRHMESEVVHSNPQRAERLELLKALSGFLTHMAADRA